MFLNEENEVEEDVPEVLTANVREGGLYTNNTSPSTWHSLFL